jgi:hypothetical protein
MKRIIAFGVMMSLSIANIISADFPGFPFAPKQDCRIPCC